jgi:hypothetical protein
MFNNIIHRKLRKKCNAITAVQHFAFPSMRPEVAGNKSGKGSRATTLSCLCWALHSLANTRSLFSLVILCVVTFAIMATASYAVDDWQDHSEQ